MKLISLNIWGGKIYQPLLSFIEDQSKTTDIFCFQEVLRSKSRVPESSGYKTNILNDITNILKDFNRYYAKTFSGYDMAKLVDFDLDFGLAIFVKKPVTVMLHKEALIHHVNKGVRRRDGYYETSRGIQSIQIKFDNKIFNIYNLHGIWTPDFAGGKEDNEERLQQSKEIEQFIQKDIGEKIIAGDFNLNPDTESLKMLEKNFKNLIKEYRTSTTRSNLYTRSHKFADYILVSDGVKIIDFQVPNITVSDHLPIILEFS
ncbi:MAG: endonuclease/exonuclease/phosphatase family protein [Candidatus Levybacteria bacterium]|nr:endonuclease/exonuclease/phosphatase family protein [Candidatus Levybacteria bacterium]